MPIERVACPKCRSNVNVPATMVSVRCPKCGTIWNRQAESDESPEDDLRDGDIKQQQKRSRGKSTGGSNRRLLVGSLIGAVFVIAVGGGLAWFLFTRQPKQVAQPEPAPAAPRVSRPVVVEYREVNLPESTRQSIYRDYRAAARTTREQRLPVPTGTAPRNLLERTLEETLQREKTHLVLIHNITADDLDQIIAEGDAKDWDPAPRSRAKRGGERLYPDETDAAPDS